MGDVSEGISAAALKRLLEACNAHDVDAVMGFFIDDCVLEMPRGPEPWVAGCRDKSRCVKVSRADSPGFPMCTMAMTATGLPGIAAAPNGS